MSTYNKSQYNPEQKRQYYLKNRNRILDRSQLKRQKKISDKPYNHEHKTPDEVLMKAGDVCSLKVAPKFRDYIRELLKEHEYRTKIQELVEGLKKRE